MNSSALDYYTYAFLHLHRDKKNGGAPHKPILLLALLHEYESGRIPDNRIFITPELTHTFSVYWNQLVVTKHDARFALPFFHLKGEKGNWWTLIPQAGCELWIDNAGSMRSFANLSAAVAYAEIDHYLAQLLIQKETRQLLKKVILREYFPNTSLEVIEKQDDNYLSTLAHELYEPVSDYRTNLQHLKAKLDTETYQIEVYNRGTIFRREVIKLYNETCAITGLRVNGLFAITMVDACHIEPFAKTFNNHPTNGIALCPNLHRAFDRGAISINEHYEVIVSEAIKENVESDYSFHKLAGKRILLPPNTKFHPALESLAWHRKNVFKG